MNKRFLAKVLSFFLVSGITLSGSNLFAYNPNAVQKALDATKNNETIKFMYTDYIEVLHISKLSGLNIGLGSIQSLCFLLNCEEEDLENLLDGTINKESDTVSDQMLDDFFKLSAVVRNKLENN